jgi:hypothetical protein
MPAVGKEIERPLTPEVTPQLIEAVPYMEKIEKQYEIKQPNDSSQLQAMSPLGKQTGDMGKVVSAQFAVQKKPNIVLPLDQKEVVEGLHHRVWEGIRWLSEWCIMMIKKYPGRVFYLPPETT